MHGGVAMDRAENPELKNKNKLNSGRFIASVMTAVAFQAVVLYLQVTEKILFCRFYTRNTIINRKFTSVNWNWNMGISILKSGVPSNVDARSCQLLQ